MQETTTRTPTSLMTGGLLGALTSIAVIAVSYLADQLANLPFVPFDIFDWLARAMPGGVITFGIDIIISIIALLGLGDTSSAAKTIEQLSAILILIFGGAVFGVVLAQLGRTRPKRLMTYGIYGGTLLLLLTLLIEVSLGSADIVSIVFLGALFLGWGVLLGWLVRRAGPSLAEDEEASLSRRQFLYVSGGGIAGITIGTLGLSSLVGGRSSGVSLADTAAGEELVKEMVGAQGTSGPAASPSAAELANRISTAPGTRPELTANDDFYRIDINTRPPVIDGATWRLSLGGLVDNRLNLTLDEIRALPSQSQVLTMQCISNRIGGDLTGTSRWTGVRFKDVLELAGVQEGAREIQIASVDGFYESVGLDEAMDERVMLVYDMNGVPLPIEHGFPLRIYLPNRYGMKQPKWIATMDVIGREGSGYWVERGWSAEAYAHTTAVVDTVSVELLEENADLETVPVGGIAWAGDRGISKVEVQVDEGPWLEAELRTPPLSSLTWVQWVYAWPYETGRHVFRARAYDGSGQLQTVVPAPPRPDGATGIHEFFLRG